MTQHHDTVRHTLDLLSVVTTLGAFLQIMSPFFGLIGAIVGVMRIVEMATGKTFSEVIRRKKAEDAE